MNAHGKNMAVQEQPSSYISNMMLPSKVKATRHHPLGPDCVISNSEFTDNDILKRMHYYWCISRENGCVECVIKRVRSQNAVSVSDPKCVITKKHRRFEAFSCMLCRTNFVTIVQALLHLKAIHRPNNKICIQDKDVFENLDKAMEVPPVPLPWHVSRKCAEPGKPQDVIGQPPTYVIPPGALAAPQFSESMAAFDSNSTVPAPPLSNNDEGPPEQIASDDSETQNSKLQSSSSSSGFMDQSPVMSILTALASKFSKNVKHLRFQKDCTEAHVLFADDTSITVEIPDLATTSSPSDDFLASDELPDQLLFYVDENKEASSGNDVIDNRIVLRTNKPRYARSLLVKSISAATPPVENHEKLQMVDCDVVSRDSDQQSNRVSSSESPPLENNTDQAKYRTPKPPKKSVRFTLGAPESSDDETSTSPDNYGVAPDPSEKTPSPEEKPKEVPSIKISEIEDAKEIGKIASEIENLSRNEANFDGLQLVIENLISTASKGRIIAPTSPLPTNAPSSSLPQVGSSPALLSLSTSLSTSGTSSLTRVQSWSPSVTSIPFSVASMRRPYTARGFTYAEKIQFMKQQNDYDAEFVNKHISTGKTSKSDEKSSSGTNSEDGSKPKRRGRKPFNFEPDDEIVKEGANEVPESMFSPAAMAAYSALLSRSLLNNTFPSEYYGLGEWASTAMESLKNLQPMLKQQEDYPSSHSSSSDVSSPQFHRKSPEASRHSRSGRSSESLSEDISAAASQSLKSKSSFPRKRSQSQSDTNLIHDDRGVSPKRKKYSTPKHDSRPSDYLDTSPSPPHLPNLQADFAKMTQFDPTTLKRLSKSLGVDKALIPSPAAPVSHPVAETSKRQPQVEVRVPNSGALAADGKIRNPSLVHLSNKNILAKCSSDSALSSSTTAGRHQSADANLSSNRASIEKDVKSTHCSSSNERTKGKDSVLYAEDKLELVKNVSLVDFQKHHAITARLLNDSKNPDNSAKGLTSMPAMFGNCIDTYVQIQCVKKVCVCKVCGFSVDVTGNVTTVDDRNPATLLEAHVMEHSLKELYATNYETTTQW